MIYNGLQSYEITTSFCIDPVTGRACYLSTRGDTSSWANALQHGPPMKKPTPRTDADFPYVCGHGPCPERFDEQVKLIAHINDAHR